MRAGRLQTRRYRVRRTRRRVFLILALLGAGAFFLARSPVFPRLQAYFVSLLPGAPVSPIGGEAQTREVTLPGGQWYALSLGTYRDAAAARQALASWRDTLSAQAARLDECFGGAAPKPAEQLRGPIAFLADALAEALNEQGSVRLGAQIKYCHLAALCRLQAWADTLAE
jgi:hypothetical protein